ncbi:hypothetical protein ACWX0P_30410 [Vibrio mediterranei]
MYIRYLCEDADATKPNYQIPNGHYLIGAYLESELYVLMFDGQPKHFLNTTADFDEKNNVVGLVQVTVGCYDHRCLI